MKGCSLLYIAFVIGAQFLDFSAAWSDFSTDDEPHGFLSYQKRQPLKLAGDDDLGEKFLQNVLDEIRDRSWGQRSNANAKKAVGGVDLGLEGRSFSGSMIGSSRSGHFSAISPRGPGRRRRDILQLQR